MSPLSNANYNKIVNVIYTIVSDKLHWNKRGGNKQKNGKNFLNKQFRWNEVILSVQSRSLFPYQKHLVNKALKFSVAFFKLVKCS